MARIVLMIAILLASSCAAFMNCRFALQLATSDVDRYVFAVFSVALDITKWFMLPCAAIDWPQHKPRALAAIAVWIVATVYSLAAVTGFAATRRDAQFAARQNQTEIRNHLATMRMSPRWTSSAACADATLPASKEFCANYRAVEARLQTGSSDSVPQLSLLAQITGLSHTTLQFALSLFVGIAAEVISALGFFVALSPRRDSPAISSTPRQPWRPPPHPRPPAAQPAQSGGVAPPRDTPRRAPTWNSPR